jgi:hypothetical protein
MESVSAENEEVIRGPQLYTIDDLVRLGNHVLQTLSAVGIAGTIPGCCTQGCCDPSVLDLISRPLDLEK